MSHLATHVDAALGDCDVWRVFDKAPHVPIAGTSTASALNEEVRADPLSLDDITALRAMDMPSKCSLLLPDQSRAAVGWDVSCSGWLGIFGPPKTIQMDDGGRTEEQDLYGFARRESN